MEIAFFFTKRVALQQKIDEAEQKKLTNMRIVMPDWLKAIFVACSIVRSINRRLNLKPTGWPILL